MASEETPLLTTRDGTAHEHVYNRFTPNQKRWILCIVSCAGSLPSKQSALYYSQSVRHAMNGLSVIVQATFVPSIPQIAKDLDSTPAIVRCVLYEP